jgi:hypothetical protein
MPLVKQLSSARSRSRIIRPNLLSAILSRVTAEFLASCAAYAQAQYPALTVVEEPTSRDRIASKGARAKSLASRDGNASASKSRNR